MTSGPAHFFIGLQKSRDRPKKKLLLSQPQYILRVLKRFHMEKCHAITVPADPNARLDSFKSPSTPEDIQMMSSTPYDEAIGFLTYASVCTCPDISFAVGQADRFCKNPGKANWATVKRILSYLAGTTTHGIIFSGEGRTNLVGYTDSDYAGDMDIRVHFSTPQWRHILGK